MNHLYLSAECCSQTGNSANSNRKNTNPKRAASRLSLPLHPPVGRVTDRLQRWGWGREGVTLEMRTEEVWREKRAWRKEGLEENRERERELQKEPTKV